MVHHKLPYGNVGQFFVAIFRDVVALRCTTGDGAREKAAILWMRDCGKATGGAEPCPYGEEKDSVPVEGQKQGHTVLSIQRKSPDPFSILGA